MDKMIRDFFWGFKDSHSHNLYLKSWHSICLSKQMGGIGIRSMSDINHSLLLKMAWNLCVEEEKQWSKLIKARYLRGRNMLEADRTTKSASWLWGGMKKCIPLLKQGVCFQVGASSELRIKETLWLPNMEGFRIPKNLSIPPQYQQIRELMVDDKEWNDSLIRSLFPPQISDQIIHTSILNEEHERPIWTPSSLGMFSVKSTYHMVVRGRNPDQTVEQQQIWKLIWGAKLHGRHQLLLWKIV